MGGKSVTQMPASKQSAFHPHDPDISGDGAFDPGVIVQFNAEGPGWQSRINEALRKAKGL